MIRSSQKHPGSLALAVERPLSAALGADSQTAFEMPGGSPILTLFPLQIGSGSVDFRAAIETVRSRYPKALKKLAELP
ncbi:MAG: AbrB/MazE/SpoVT family DNA-binding domain-containing protein [Deltaproteobacteria bacterium]|nr:AbrB/MazE/SpoVT family DNA-binding domain-containing protein [Deltaproteobacteria bacterium]